MSTVPAEAPTAAEVMGRVGTENFPIASLMFRRAMRPHLESLYGFCRLVDNIGDDAQGDRLALLDWLSLELDEIYGDGSPGHVLMRRLSVTIRRFDLPRGPFDRLIQANRQDQIVHAYETFDDLRAYCDKSATPVGELCLHIFGLATPRRIELSDATCTGLQLVDFWQDLGDDATRGRLYVPLEDMARFGYSREDLQAGVRNDRFVALMGFEAERAGRLLEEGKGLARTLRGRTALAVRMFTAGGLAALDDLQRRRFDTLSSNAHPSKARRTLFAIKELVA